MQGVSPATLWIVASATLKVDQKVGARQMLKGDVKMDFWVLELKNHSLRYIKRNGTTFNFKQPGRSIGANIRSCAEGGFTALINEEQQIAAFGVVLVAMDSIPVVGEFAISAEAAGTALNVAYGCVTSIASDNM